MKFNLHHGAMKFDVAGKEVYRDKSPKKSITMKRIDGGGHNGRYEADEMGNIEVTISKHIDTLVTLGYPIYNGDGKLAKDGEGRVYPIPRNDLLYPNKNLTSQYWQKVMEEKNRRR